MEGPPTGLAATLGGWRDRTTVRLQEGGRGPWVRALRLVLLLGIVGLLLVQLSRVGWGDIGAALPNRPLFYVLLLGAYFALPATEILIYRRLWPIAPGALFLACARKRVLNEEVLGYSGELGFYLWAAGRGVEPQRAFRVVRDVNIISSVVSFTVAAVLVAVMASLGEIDLSGWVGEHTFYLAAGLVVLAGLVLLGVRFRQYVFALPAREAARIGALHAGRHAVTTALLVAMWHVAQPNVGLGVWLSFAAVLVVIERLPFLPSKDLVFLSASVELSKTMSVAAAAMAGMLLVQSGVFKLLHVLVLVASAVALRRGDAEAELTAQDEREAGGREVAAPDPVVRS